MAGSIICGVDDSASAKGAARVARALAAQLGTRLLFVRVVEPDPSSAKVSAAAERLERLSAEASEVDCGATWTVDAGHPADRLVAAAAQVGAAMIVVGSTGPRSSSLASISTDVSRRAPCPVVVVPPGADGGVDGHRRRGRTAEEGDSGGIVRLGVRGGGGHLAGGIARFGLRASRPGE